MNILIAEDEDLVREILSEEIQLIFKEKSELVTNGEEALEKCLKNKYKLIILDYKMPKINGDKLIDQIRLGGSLNKNTPIILISAYLNSDISDSAQKRNVRVIRKPFNFEDLQDEIEFILRS